MADELNFKQELVGVFGWPVAENPTQAMVEAAFQHHGLDWRYLTLEVKPENLADAVAGARAMGFRGFNCTIPHKIDVIDHLDGMGESARTMGAVNCVVEREGKLIGENTDGKGFLSALAERVDPAGMNLLVFGAGGAARAIAVEAALAGAENITIVNRTESRGRELVDLINERTPAKAVLEAWDGEYRVAGGMDAVVNATSIGLYPDVDARLALDISTLESGTVVGDVIPNPPRTRLVRDAEAAGCRVIDGLEMLVNQGVLGIEFWTGVLPDPAVMRRALETVFGREV